MEYYVIVSEWCVDYQSGHQVVGVYTSEEEALIAFRERVSTEDRMLANENGYTIYEDTNRCFDAGIDGYYPRSHVYVGVETVTMELSE